MKKERDIMATNSAKKNTVDETQNLELMLELEKKVRLEEKQRKKAVTDQVLRFLGLILASIIFLISFSMLAGLTLFGYAFSSNDPYEVWRSGMLAEVFQSGSIYYSFIGPDPTIAILLMTIIQVSLAFGLAFLVSYYVRDLIGIIKNILGLGKNIAEELGTNIKEGVEDIVGVNKDGKKSLFGWTEKKDKPAKKSKAEKELEKLQKEAQKSGVELNVKAETVSEEDLDKALTDPNFKPAQPVEPKKSLFDGK